VFTPSSLQGDIQTEGETRTRGARRKGRRGSRLFKEVPAHIPAVGGRSRLSSKKGGDYSPWGKLKKEGPPLFCSGPPTGTGKGGGNRSAIRDQKKTMPRQGLLRKTSQTKIGFLIKVDERNMETRTGQLKITAVGGRLSLCLQGRRVG